MEGFTVSPELYPVKRSVVPGTELSPVQVRPPSSLNSIVPKVVGYPVNSKPKSFTSPVQLAGVTPPIVAVSSSGLLMVTGVSVTVHPVASVTLMV